jgi:hypothetical protein
MTLYSGVVVDTPDTAYSYIYALADMDGTVRYVGKSYRPLIRYTQHIRDCHESDTHKNRWLRKIIAEGQKPRLIIIEKTDVSSSIAKEQYWIEYYRGISSNKFTNATKGGVGKIGYKTSEETKRKIGQSKKGQNHREESSKKMSIARRGKTKSKEHRSNIGKAHKGRPISDETKERLRLAWVIRRRRMKNDKIDNLKLSDFKVGT